MTTSAESRLPPLLKRLRPPLSRGYRAFISYKHATSRTFVVKLESALKIYARPVLRPPMRLFRDEKVIRAGDDLPERIRTALVASDYLILVASPEAAVSPWVSDELRQWCGELKRAGRLIVVLTDGEIAVDEVTKRIRWHETSALPRFLAEHVTYLPVWVDLRGMSDKDWSLENLRFSDAVNSISARLRDITPEEMNDEHVLQHRRNVRLRNGAVTLIGVALVVSIAMSILLWLSRQEVVRQRNTSESRRLAALSSLERSGGRLDLATRLAAEGLQIADTAEARSSLLASLQQWTGKEAILPCRDCEISEMAFCEPDEALPRGLLAIGTARGDVLVRDVKTREAFSPTRNRIHRAAINAMAFNPSGTLLASAGVGADQQVVLWKVGKVLDDPILEPIDVHSGVGWAVAFSPDGSRLATARADGSIQVGNVSAKAVEFPSSMRGHRGFVFSLAFAPDGRRLASGGMDGIVRVWNIDKGALAFGPLVGHQGPVGRVTFSPDGRLLASAGHDGTVRVWDAVTGTASGEPLSHGDLVSSVAFSPDGAIVASAGRDGSVVLWNVLTHERMGEPMHGHRGGVARALFLSGRATMDDHSPFDGSLLASGGNDGNVVLWRLSGRGYLARTLDSVEEASALAFGPSGGLLAVAGARTIQLLDANTEAGVGAKMDAGDGDIATIAISPDARLLASGDLAGKIQLWDVASSARSGAPLVGHSGFVHALAFSPDGARLASSGSDGVIVWDLAQRQAVGDRLVDQDGDVYCVAYSPDGRLLASGARDASIVLRDGATLETIGAPLRGHLQGVTGVAFDRSSTTLVSGSFDGTIRLWHAAGGAPLGEPLRLAGAPITTIALSPDAKTIAAGATDGAIALWDIAGRQVLGLPLRSHRDRVTALSFSHDGRILGSVASDGRAELWSVDAEAWRALAERLAGVSSATRH